MARFIKKAQQVLNAATGTDHSSAINVEDLEYIVVQVIGATSTDGSLLFKHSVSDTAPTFTSAASVTNAWSTIRADQLALSSSNLLAGATGLSLAAGVFHLMIDVRATKWLCLGLSGNTAGSVTAYIYGASSAK